MVIPLNKMITYSKAWYPLVGVKLNTVVLSLTPVVSRQNWCLGLTSHDHWCQGGVKLNTGVKPNTNGVKSENIFTLDTGVKLNTNKFLFACVRNVRL